MPPLTDAKIRAIQPVAKTRRYTDADGLYLEVTPEGGRYWRQKYRYDGREKRLAHGVYPGTTLAQARAKRDDARALIRAGVDPSDLKRARRRAAENHFQSVADEWLKKQRAPGKDGKPGLADATYEKNVWMLEKIIYPHIGRRPISKITSGDVLDCVLRRLDDAGKAETAHRTRQMLGRIFRYAIATRRADYDPTAALKGALAPNKPVSHAALTDEDAVAGMLLAIAGYQGTASTCAALQVSPYLFQRPGEIRQMEWDELDLDGAMWRIPEHKMKSRREHWVPLARQVVKILRAHRPLSVQSRWVFPAIGKRGTPISDNTVNYALRRLGYDGTEMTAHGFRSTASTLLNEMGFDSRVIEKQLAHEDRVKDRGIYNRAQYLPQRKKLMQAWADHLDKLRQRAAAKPRR